MLLCLFAITRLLFLAFNFNYFSHTENLFTPFLYGIRFDLVVICWLNGLLFLLLVLPFRYAENTCFILIYRILFVTVNASALLFNCIDIGYFEFIQKRSTFDLFQTLGGNNDGMQLLPQYISDYWYVLLVWIMVIFALIYFSKSNELKTQKLSNKSKVLELAFAIFVFIPLLVLGSRGGWQYRPLDMISASNYAQGKQVALVLNSPFCILKSANKVRLEKLKYFDDSKLHSVYSTFHFNKDSSDFKNKNVVIIIMESFGSEYTGLSGDQKSLTPVFDSLAKQGKLFSNAYANGKTSIKGIPAIVAGIPTLFDGSFTYSAYNANTFESVATLLRKKGYSTSFYHGGNNGTMGFDVFAKAAGFNRYYGRNEYPGTEDFDGHWGIYDEPFFQFFKQGLDAEKEPFVSCFFSLSSHHPYTLPDKYKGKFKGNSLVISPTIEYADYALGQFFKAAQRSDWYKNTIFVITADHTSISNNERYQTDAGIYSIPLLFFEPSNQKAEIIQRTVQQIDILPIILSQLHYDLPFFAFGNELNFNNEGFAISFNGQYYQIITDNYCLQFDGEKTVAIYDKHADPFQKTNLLNKQRVNILYEENLIKAIIQTYNHCLIENKMTLK